MKWLRGYSVGFSVAVLATVVALKCTNELQTNEPLDMKLSTEVVHTG